jgi:hypothetical protein
MKPPTDGYAFSTVAMLMGRLQYLAFWDPISETE